MTITVPLEVEIVAITPNNLKQLQSINIATLPVRYTDKFYNDLLVQYNHEYLKFAIWNGFTVAAVCARVEKIDGIYNITITITITIIITITTTTIIIIIISTTTTTNTATTIIITNTNITIIIRYGGLQ